MKKNQTGTARDEINAGACCRLDAVLTMLRGWNVVDVAKKLKVGRPNLSRMRNGKAKITKSVAARIQKRFGVSSEWLLANDEEKLPVFAGDADVENSKEVAAAIEEQVRRGGVRTWSLPVLCSVDEYSEEKLGSGGYRGWKKRPDEVEFWRAPRHAIAPTAAIRKAGFYVEAGSSASVIGCDPRALVLFLPAKIFFGNSSYYTAGASISCITQEEGRIRVERFTLIDVRSDWQEEARTGFAKPLDEEFDFTIRLPKGDATIYFKEEISTRESFEDVEIVAVALRAEVDLVVRGENGMKC